MIFGGRRATVVPLVTEAFGWKHGVFMGATMSSEMTAPPPVASVLPSTRSRCCRSGHNMAEYIQHWLDIGGVDGAQLPKLFYVNWFRKDPETGRFLWPGSARTAACWPGSSGVATGRGGRRDTDRDRPAAGGLNVEGIDISAEDIDPVVAVDPAAFRAQLPQFRENLEKFGDDLPSESARS